MFRPSIYVIACTLVVTLVPATSSAIDGAPPVSTRFASLGVDALITLELAAPDAGALLLEDVVADTTHGPRRVAQPLDVDDLNLGERGTWETVASGGQVCRLAVFVPGAVFLSFKFSRFELPPGAMLHFVSVDHAYTDGPYGPQHQRTTGRFGSPMVPGERAVIEVFVPAGEFALELESVSYGYRDAFGMSRVPLRRDPGMPSGITPGGGPFACQRDINCPEGDSYQVEKRAVAEGYDGSFVCTGQLLNNTDNDGRYLYLTATHCEFWLDPSTLAFYWNYENSTCGASDAPFTFSTGAVDLFHSTWPLGDVSLFELDGTDLEGQYDVSYLGWDRGSAVPTSSATIGFPADKPKQISIDDDSAIDCAGGCGVDSFGTEFWRIDDYEVGTTEGGSSGGALLDQNHRVVGVLTGGVGSNCNNFEWDEFYKLSAEWSDLEPFLDPAGTGAMTVDLWDGSSTPPPTFVRADVNDDGAVNIADAVASLSALFDGTIVPNCDDATDANDDGAFDIADAVHTLSNLFSGGPPPAAPFPTCGVDPTGDTLSCDAFTSCP